MTRRRALITNGGCIIGSVMSRAPRRQGHHHIVHGRGCNRQADLVVEDARAGGGSAEAVYFDLTDEPAAAKELSALLEDGPIQVLVNNTSIHNDSPLAGMSGDQQRSVIEGSLFGCLAAGRSALGEATCFWVIPDRFGGP